VVAAAAAVIAAAASPVADDVEVAMQAKRCNSQIGMRRLQSLQKPHWALDMLIEVTLSGDWTSTLQYVGGRQEQPMHIP
jgi:hypothetical protein